jgi:abortive infection bacteriophage resistance protein
MVIDDIKTACFHLQHINYYRLGAYWLPFEINPVTHDFKAGTNFTTVLALYNFDRELRLLVIDALERIEISMRTQWTYYMAHNHGSHSHLDENLAFDAWRYKQNLDGMAKEVARADEVFIRHSRDTYKEALPAVWIVSEVISLGLLSKLYGNLKPRPTSRAIAEIYNLDKKVLASWLHHLTHIRNLCAHHSRLWNREFVNIPMQPKNKPSELAGEFIKGSRKLYNTLVILLYCMDIIAPQHRWRQRLKALLDNPTIPLAAMDFPADWKAHKIW